MGKRDVLTTRVDRCSTGLADFLGCPPGGWTTLRFGVDQNVRMTEARRLNRLLQGSPYCFEDNREGNARAREVLDQMIRIQARQREVSQQLGDQAEVIRQELERDFDVRFIYESNAIEGVPTTLAETQHLLSTNAATIDFVRAYTFGRQVAEDPRLVEVIGHRDAIRFARELAMGTGQRVIREIDIRNMHRMVMAAEPRIAGQYKLFDNTIGAREDLLTARSDDVGWHMAQLVEWMNTTAAAGPLLASVVHAWLTNIHPFEDGNGRVARLLANYTLYRQRWSSLVVKSGSDRGQYYEALAHSDEGGDILPLFELFVKGIERALVEMSDPEFARRLLRADIGRVDEYELWGQTLRAFTRVLQEELVSRDLDLEVVGSLQASDFVLLQGRNASGNGWYAKVFSADRTFDTLIWFGYASDELLGAKPHADPTPSLFFSERDSSPDFPHPYRWLQSVDDLHVIEVSLRPRSSTDRATLRTTWGVESARVDKAARAVADSLATLRSRLATTPSRHL